MKTTARPAGRTRLKRHIAALCVAIGFCCLAAQAYGVRVVHHSLGATILAMLPSALGVLCGLEYLRSTRGRP